jgi:1-aminocyclopropane-1-carboxylate deaminase/D-cysteine desulfhydrase-like pyridoxal-dependent ACC family enzyme
VTAGRAPLGPADLRGAAERLPRVRFAHLPTPLEELPRLSEALGVRVLIKRDDCTGLALGGNKNRQLEFTVGEALALGCDTLVQGAAAQSNHCRQAAAAAARFGLECHLVLTRDAHSEPAQGNLLLDQLFGAHIHWFEGSLGASLEAAKRSLADGLAAQGKKPYTLTPPRAHTLGAVAHALAIAELAEQLEQTGRRADWYYICSAGATQAGCVLGARALGDPLRVVGIAPIEYPGGNRGQIADFASRAAELLGLDLQITAEDVTNDTSYVGERYGVVTPAGLEAVRLLARTEGIVTEPVYTGKALAGLIDHARRGLLAPGATVVFVHTGGTPALFAYQNEIAA